MASKSERMAWNNDGMDPDWRPASSPELGLIKTIRSIYYALSGVSMRFDKWTEEELDKIEKEEKVLTCHFTVEEVRKIRKLIQQAR